MAHIIALIRGLLVSLGIIPKPDFILKGVSSHPAHEEVRSGWIYVVGENGYKKWAYFRCPADEKEIIQLSLMPNRRPRWEVRTDLLQRPTVYPSVRQLDGSYAHFWIKKGAVEWCEDSGRSSYGPGRDKHVHIEA